MKQQWTVFMRETNADNSAPMHILGILDKTSRSEATAQRLSGSKDNTRSMNPP